MAYDQLSAVLSSFEPRPLAIKAAFIFKFGALELAEAAPKDDEPYRYSALKELQGETWEAHKQMLSLITTALEQHPNVFHLKAIQPDVEFDTFGLRTGMLVDGPLFKLDVQLPPSRRHFQKGHCPERFSVLWGGSYFAAYAPVEDLGQRVNVAHEFRELARKQIEQETKYLAPLFGPTPFHSDIIVIFSKGEEKAGEAIRSFEDQGDLYVLADSSLDPAQVMQEIFGLCYEGMGGFYQLMLNRSDYLDLDAEIQNRLMATSEMVNELARVPAWKIWKSSRIARDAAIQISEMYKLIVEFDGACWDYDKQRESYLRELRSVEHISKIRSYLEDECERDFRLPGPISPALQFLEKQIELTRNIRSLVLASLLGAALGSLITGILALIRSH